jgi:hypothetical protein
MLVLKQISFAARPAGHRFWCGSREIQNPLSTVAIATNHPDPAILYETIQCLQPRHVDPSQHSKHRRSGDSNSQYNLRSIYHPPHAHRQQNQLRQQCP